MTQTAEIQVRTVVDVAADVGTVRVRNGDGGMLDLVQHDCVIALTNHELRGLHALFGRYLAAVGEATTTRRGGKRVRVTDDERARMRALQDEGRTIAEIATVLGRGHSTVKRVLGVDGGAA